MAQPSGVPNTIICDGCGNPTRRVWVHKWGKYCPTCKKIIQAQQKK